MKRTKYYQMPGYLRRRHLDWAKMRIGPLHHRTRTSKLGLMFPEAFKPGSQGRDAVSGI